jgi:uncharacterized protein involved in cysteine biosynthesis
MIFSDFAKALAQMGDPRFRRVLFIGIGLTVALLFVFYALFLWAMQGMTGDSVTIPGIGPVGWLGDLLSWGSLLVVIFLSSFLMVPVASSITSLFLDDVAQAVEDKHYPHLPVPPRVSFSDGLRDTLSFLGLLIGANIVALFLYVVLPIFTPFIFYGLNGFLLGREYFQLAAMRREGREGARRLWSANRITIWAAGVLMALPLSIPLLNLVIPVLGAATFTHLYHRLARR